MEISKTFKADINKIVDLLVKYQNKDNLTWTQVYKNIVKKLNLDIRDNKLLSSTIKEITNRGYDIIGEPFQLEKYK